MYLRAGFAALPGLRLALLGGLRSVFHESNDPSSAASKKSRVKHGRAQPIPIIPIIFNPFHILSKHLFKHSNLFISVSFLDRISKLPSADWHAETLPWISQYLSTKTHRLDIRPMNQTLVDIQPNPTLAYRFVVSYWGRQLTLWSIQPSQGSEVLLHAASY